MRNSFSKVNGTLFNPTKAGVCGAKHGGGYPHARGNQKALPSIARGYARGMHR
jgi:hypothetical protein